MWNRSLPTTKKNGQLRDCAHELRTELAAEDRPAGDGCDEQPLPRARLLLIENRPRPRRDGEEREHQRVAGDDLIVVVVARVLLRHLRLEVQRRLLAQLHRLLARLPRDGVRVGVRAARSHGVHRDLPGDLPGGEGLDDVAHDSAHRKRAIIAVARRRQDGDRRLLALRDRVAHPGGDNYRRRAVTVLNECAGVARAHFQFKLKHRRLLHRRENLLADRPLILHVDGHLDARVPTPGVGGIEDRPDNEHQEKRNEEAEQQRATIPHDPHQLLAHNHQSDTHEIVPPY